MRRPLPDLSALTEKEWEAQIFNSQKGLATTLGWSKLCYHTLRSKGSQSGFPDRVLVRDRVIFAEMKRESGKPTETQKAWLTGLAKAGAEVYLWKPSDLAEIGKILSKRWYWQREDASLADAFERFYPGSAWLEGGRRSDEMGWRSAAA